MTHKDIRFLRVFPLRGPSMWTYRPVIELWADIGDLEDCPSNTIPGFVERLCEWLPGLSEHRCNYGVPGGFVRRLHEGTWPCHIMEHVALELQNLAGVPGGFGRARETSQRGVYKVVVSASDEETARASLEEARELVMAAIEGRTFDAPAAVERLGKIAAKNMLGPNTRCIVDAATSRERGIPAIRLSAENLVQLGYGAKQRRIWAAQTDQTGAIAEWIAGSPDLTNQLLERAGLPVPERRRAESLEAAREAAEDIGLPVMVKRGGNSGRVDEISELESVYQQVTSDGAGVMVESAIKGHACRLLVVGQQVVAAARVEEGSDQSLDVTNAIHPTIRAAACLAARVVGLDIAGVDMVLEDEARPLAEQHGAIMAVQAGPSLVMHARKTGGEELPVGLAIVDHLFPNGDTGRIPVVGISGTRGTADVALLLSEFLDLAGKFTGVACGKGLYFDRRRVAEGPCGDWQNGRRVLMNRSVEVAVLENRADIILEEGLAYDRCSVGVVMKIDPAAHYGSHYIETPEQVFKVLRTQVDVVLPDGIAVLDASDPQVVEMAPLCDGEVVFFSANPALEAIADHRGRGGRAVVARDGFLVLATGSQEQELVALEEIPWLANGDRDARLDSVLAAVAVAWTLEVPNHVIRTGAETFCHPDLHNLPVDSGMMTPTVAPS